MVTVPDEVVCPECGSKRLYVDSRRAELVCDSCGAVAAERMIDGSREPSEQASGGNDNRVLPQLFFAGRDSEGRPVADKTLRTLRQTAKMQNLKSSERALLNFESKTQQLARQRSIPDSVSRRAIDMHHRIRGMRVTPELKALLVRWNFMGADDPVGGPVFNKPNLTELSLALLRAACSDMKYMITYRDLIGGAVASERKVRDYSHKIALALGHGGPDSSAQEFRFGKMSVEQLVAYFAAKLNVASQGQVLSAAFRTVRLGKGWSQFERSGQSIASGNCVAAAALYIAMRNSGATISQREFCLKVNLSEISLRDWVERLGGYDAVKFEPSRIKPEQLDDP